MLTFREEVEGAYELNEGALSQVTVNGAPLRYVDRLPKIAVALGQPLSGPGRPANRRALLRILKRALSKFHEDKRAIAKARGEEISEYTEWMRAMVEQALLVAKEALEEDDFPFQMGNALTGPFARTVMGPHGSNTPWPKADRDGDVAVSGFAAHCAAHLVCPRRSSPGCTMRRTRPGTSGNMRAGWATLGATSMLPSPTGTPT